MAFIELESDLDCQQHGDSYSSTALLAADRRGGSGHSSHGEKYDVVSTRLAADRRRGTDDDVNLDEIGERARDSASSCSGTIALPNTVVSEPIEPMSEGAEVDRGLTDWERRKRAKLKKAALVKETSNARWLTSNVPAVFRARFPHMFKNDTEDTPQPRDMG